MVDKAKPTTGAPTDGAKIGNSGDTFKLQARTVIGDFNSPFTDTTGEDDTGNAYALTPWAFSDKQFVFSGWLVGGVVMGLAQLGATDAGVAVIITLQSGHTVAGNVCIYRIRWSYDRKSPAIPCTFLGMGAGEWAEAAV